MKHVFITSEPSPRGNGSEAYPFSTSQVNGLIDGIWNRFVTEPDTTVHLNGKFITRGRGDVDTGGGIRLISDTIVEGNGSVIRLEPISNMGERLASVFFSRWGEDHSNCFIKDVFFDLGPNQKMAVSAVALHGSRIRIHNCKADARHTSSKVESFIFSLLPLWAGKNSAIGSAFNEIRGCIVHISASTPTACTAFINGSGGHGSDYGNNAAWMPIIVDCMATSTAPETADHVTHGFTMTGCRNGLIARCLARGTTRGFYADTGGTPNLTINKCLFQNVKTGIYWNHEDKDKRELLPPLGVITVMQNEILVRHQNGAKGVYCRQAIKGGVCEFMNVADNEVRIMPSVDGLKRDAMAMFFEGVNKLRLSGNVCHPHEHINWPPVGGKDCGIVIDNDGCYVDYTPKA